MVTGVFTIPLPAADNQFCRDGVVSKPKSEIHAFIGGRENRLLFAALQPFLRSHRLARCASPLVLCGESGSGKTHLALGLVASWSIWNGSQKVEFVDASKRRGRTTRSETSWEEPTGLLVIENIDCLPSTTTAALRICRLLDAYQSHSRGVIVTASRLPTQLRELSKAIRSRLSGGLVVPLCKPAIETRKEVVKIYAGVLGIEFTEAAIDLLIKRVETTTGKLIKTIREIYSWMPRGECPLLLDEDLITRYLASSSGATPATMHQISVFVSRHYGIPVSALRGRSRRQGIALVRGVVMYLGHRHAGHSLTHVGNYLDGRDHTTVLHGCRTVERKISIDSGLKQDVWWLCDLLGRETPTVG